MARLPIALLFAALAILVAGPVPAMACQTSSPTFRQAVHGARAIARVTIVEGADRDIDDPTRSESFRVERVLKGSLPAVVTLAPAWTDLCHDTVSGWVPEGAAFILAVDVRYSSGTIHPMWVRDPGHGIAGSAGAPSGVRTLRQLEAAILAELGVPETSTAAVTAASEPRASPPWPLVLVLALATAFLTIRHAGRGLAAARHAVKPVRHAP